MEYAKDVSFNLKCGNKENIKTHRTNLISKCMLKAKKHKTTLTNTIKAGEFKNNKEMITKSDEINLLMIFTS